MPHPIFSLLAQSHDKCLRADSVELGKRRLAKSRSASAASPDESNVFKAASPASGATTHSGAAPEAQDSAFQPAAELPVQADSSETAQSTFCPIEMDSIRADSIVLARVSWPVKHSVIHRGVHIDRECQFCGDSLFPGRQASGPNMSSFPACFCPCLSNSCILTTHCLDLPRDSFGMFTVAMITHITTKLQSSTSTQDNNGSAAFPSCA